MDLICRIIVIIRQSLICGNRITMYGADVRIQRFTQAQFLCWMADTGMGPCPVITSAVGVDNSPPGRLLAASIPADVV